MRYMLIQDDIDPNNTAKMYYVFKDEINEVVGVIDENCNSIAPPSSHRIIDNNPPLPPCIQQQQPEP